jgi:phage terminase small subunit
MPKVVKSELTDLEKRFDLTPKEKIFVEEYVIHHSGAKASRAAGYKGDHSTTSSEILRRPRVKRAIWFLERKLCEARRLKADTVVEQLYFCLARTVLDYVDEKGKLLPVSQLSRAAAAAVDGVDQVERSWVDSEGNEHHEVTTRLKLVPKAAAIDMAMKFKGLYQGDTVQHTHTVAQTDWNALYERQETPSNVIDVQAEIKGISDPSQTLPDLSKPRA